jgi:gamma-glutamyltranspeptidase
MLICVRNGEFRFTMGSPGGFVIPPAVAHGTLAALRTAQSADVDLVDVVSTPRLAPINDGVVIVESRISDNVRTHVSATATVKDVGPWSWLLGSLNCVGANQSGELIGVADPRRGGAARAAS